MQLSQIPPPSVLLPMLGKFGNESASDYPWDHSADLPILVAGTDCARFGPDSNVMLLRHPSMSPLQVPTWIVGYIKWSGLDEVYSAALISTYIARLEEQGWIVLWNCIDSIGPGAGICDILRNSSERLRLMTKPINVAKASKSRFPTFRNVRAELSWNCRRYFRYWMVRFLSSEIASGAGLTAAQGAKRRAPIGIPDHITVDKLKEQATTLQYKSDDMYQAGLSVESKATYKDRTKAGSPDEFDALYLSMNDSFAGLEVQDAEVEEMSVATLGGRYSSSTALQRVQPAAIGNLMSRVGSGSFIGR